MRSQFVAVLVSLFMANVSHAVLLTAEPDSFPAGTNISNAFPGIALISVGAGFDGDFDPNIFAINSTNGGEPFVASTGVLVFGTNDANHPNLFGGSGDAVLRVDFVTPTTLVLLDAIGNDSSDFAQLEAYSAADVLLDTYTTASLATSAVETMSISDVGSNIAYVFARGFAGDSVGFDYLRFQGVPEPCSLALLLIGGVFTANRGVRRRE